MYAQWVGARGAWATATASWLVAQFLAPLVNASYMIGSGSRARSAAPTRPALLPSWAAITSATGRQLPPTSQRL